MNVNNANRLPPGEILGDENATQMEIIPTYESQWEDYHSKDEFSDHNSFTSEPETGDFDDNFYDVNGNPIMTFNRQADVVIEGVSDRLEIAPTANQQQNETLVPFLQNNSMAIENQTQNANNTLNLHPAFADNNKNSNAVDNAGTRMAIEDAGAINRRSDLRYAKKNRTIARIGTKALEKLNTKRQRRRIAASHAITANNANQIIATDNNGDQRMLTYNNVAPVEEMQQFPERQLNVFNPNYEDALVQFRQPNFSQHREIDSIVPRQPPSQFQYNFTYNNNSQQEAIEDAPRPFKAVTFQPELSRKERRRKAIRNKFVSDKRLALYNKRHSNNYAPPIGVLQSIGAIPHPDVPVIPVIEASRLNLAIANTPHWDTRALNASAPLIVTNDVLKARNEDKKQLLNDLPAIKWLNDKSTLQMREKMHKNYEHKINKRQEQEQSVVDNLKNDRELIQKHPKYLGKRNAVNFDNLHGQELLESIVTKQLAGVKRKYQKGRGSQPLNTDYGKLSRKIAPTNYDPYTEMSEMGNRDLEWDATALKQEFSRAEG